VLGHPQLTPDELDASRNIINRQVRHMAWLLDDLLDISRISAGRLQLSLRFHSLHEVVQAAIETAQPLIDEKHHALYVDLPLLDVEVDEVRLSQVLANLLLNAAKYTSPGGRIGITAQVEADELVIAISDNGIGITPEQLPCVFDMFSSLRNTSDHSRSGLGIGLALSRGLVELHCGHLVAQSAGLGCGSTFSLVLPARLIGLKPVSLDIGAPQPTANRSGKTVSLSILIADDNHDAAESLAMLLSMAHHEVHVAGDGVSALALAAQVRPQVALLDIGMPGLDGHEVARRLRREPWGTDMLIMALTGWGQQDDQSRSRAAGFDHHYTKPVDPQAMIDRLAAWHNSLTGVH